jgi:hypothetical protein
MAEPTDPVKPDAELTGKQDLTSASGLPLLGTIVNPPAGLPILPSSAAFGAYGSSGAYNPYAGAVAFYGALYGSGAVDGRNPYAPPGLLPITAGPTMGGMLPGYSKPWPGTYATYRVMAAHPTIVLAAAAVILPVLAAEWQVTADKKKAPAGAEEFISDLLIPQRGRIVSECLRSLTFGSYAAEIVHTIKDGFWTVAKFKWLLPELNEYLVDEHGNLAGIRNGTVVVPAAKSFVHVCDREGDYYYGRSRMENCRRTWANWLAVDDNLYRLGVKVASIIPRVGYPPGEGLDEAGKKINNAEGARRVAYGMTEGRPVTFPNLSNLSLDDLKDLPNAAKLSLWSIDTIDMGNTGPAQSALIEQLKYMDMLIVRAWGQPERSVLEATRSGSRADSESHGDLATAGAEAVHESIVDSINRQVVDPLIRANFGEEAVGTVRLEAVPMVDERQDIDRAILDGMAANPTAFIEALRHTDMDALMDRLGAPRNEDAGEWRFELPAPTADKGAKPPVDEDEANKNLSAAIETRMHAAGYTRDVIDAVRARVGRKSA